MSAYDELYEEGERLLDELNRKYRETARQLLATNPEQLTAHHKRLLGDELVAYEKEVEARRKQQLEHEQRAAELRSVLVPDDESNPLLAKLAEDIVQLCLQFNIRAILCTRDGVNGYADDEKRLIAVRPIISEAAYATALHEVGHVLKALRPSGYSKEICGHQYSEHPKSELRAWQWAVRYSEVWSRKMHDNLVSCLERESETFRRHTDGDGDLEPFAMCIRESALKIADRPITFGELDRVCHSIITGDDRLSERITTAVMGELKHG